MNKRKLRRVAIVALVLVLLCNTLGVQASTKKDDPTVIVKDYGSLYTAIAEAKDNDVIGIQGTITIPAIVDLNMSENKAVILRRMEAGAKLVVSGDYGADNRASFRMIEDLLSESYIALIKAVDNFDPTRGVTFTTALKVFVRQHLNRLYNEVTCQKRYNGMDPASYEELVEIHKDDVRGLDCDRFTQIEVDEYLEGLEAKDRYMVTLLLMGYSLSDCAKAFHVANSSITWRIKRIRKNYAAYSMAV